LPALLFLEHELVGYFQSWSDQGQEQHQDQCFPQLLVFKTASQCLQDKPISRIGPFSGKLNTELAWVKSHNA